MASGKGYANPKNTVNDNSNMYKVLSSTTHCLHPHNNPLLIWILLPPLCTCTEKLINLPKVTQPIRSRADFETKPFESRLCSRIQDAQPAFLWENTCDPQWKRKCATDEKQKWSSMVPQEPYIAKSYQNANQSNHKTCLLLLSPFL